MYGLMMDISLRKQIEQDRQWVLQAERQARNEAERVSRLKDEFLATVSHELRTPLTVISGWTRLLLQGKAGEARKALESVMRGATNLTQLVEDLLDMSQVISGQVHLEEQFADLAPIVREAVESVMFAARAKSISLDVFLDPDLLPIVCDRRRIQQIIWNLLTNAVKFTPAGGHVEICVAQAVETIEIVVSDTGQGISPDFVPHLFERFRQADGSTTRRHGGLGLGLAIVKHLIELHGGRVWAESEGQDKGSRFTVSIPRAGMVPVVRRSTLRESHKQVGAERSADQP
jgi:signal transduction histidine kinase